MTIDELTQAMRTTSIGVVRMRLMDIETRHPQYYRVICNLFAPPAENKKRWSAKVAPAMKAIRENL